MYTSVITHCNRSVYLTCESVAISEYISNYFKYSPSQTINNETNEHEILSIIYYNRLNANTILKRISRNQYEISLPFQIIVNTQILANLIFNIIELDRQHHNQFLFHCSAVSKNGNSILLIGPSYAGKTTVALDLCRHHSFELVCNDQAVLTLLNEHPTVIFGDKSFNFKYSSLNQYSKKLGEQVFGEVNYSTLYRNELKKRVLPETVNVVVNSSELVPVIGIVFLDLGSNTSDSRYEATLSTHELNIHYLAKLYIELTYSLAGLNIVPFDHHHLDLVDSYIPSLDTPLAQKHRRYLLKCFSRNCKFITCRYSLEDTISSIISFAQHNIV